MTGASFIAASLDLHRQIVDRYGLNPEIIEDMWLHVDCDQIVCFPNSANIANFPTCAPRASRDS
jgi:hypothetical protein